VVWKRVVTRRGWRGERKREEERIGRISLFIPATDPAECGFRPDLSNPRTYTDVGLTYPTRSGRKPSRDLVAHPVPADRPDAIDVRLQSSAEERKKNKESSEREMGFFEHAEEED
jgi:hypothetical protein